MDISHISFVAIQIALKAGNLLKKGFGSVFEIQNKEGKHNLVTEYDLLSEKMILNMIHEHFPDHRCLSEECGKIKGTSKEYQWIIDPLDGTVNFAHSIPMFAVSIGVTKGTEVVCGVVYQPMTNELFIAEKNKGAFLNGIKLTVSKTSSLENAFLATGFPYNIDQNPQNSIEKLGKLLHMGIPIRRIGVASIDLSYVAAGRFDGFFEIGLKPWDCAAAKLLIEEAGGKLTTWINKPFDILSDEPIVATNSLIHSQLTDILRQEYK